MYHIGSGVQKLQYLVFLDRSPGRFQGLTHLPTTTTVMLRSSLSRAGRLNRPFVQNCSGYCWTNFRYLSFHPSFTACYCSSLQTLLQSAKGNSLLQPCHCKAGLNKGTLHRSGWCGHIIPAVDYGVRTVTSENEVE